MHNAHIIPDNIMSDHVTTPKLALLERVRERLADGHEAQTLLDEQGHKAIANCNCEMAREYRAVKGWIYSERHFRQRIS
jgi:hypothetical protein